MQPNWLATVRGWLHAIIRAFTWIAAAALCMMALVIVTNVIGRYLFRMPLRGTVELVELLLVVTVFFAVAHTEVQKGHVTMDEVVARFPRRARALLMSFMYFVGGVFLLVMGWQDWGLAVSYARPAMRATDVLKIPIAPFIFIVAIGALLLGLELLLNAVSTLPAEHNRKDEVE